MFDYTQEHIDGFPQTLEFVEFRLSLDVASREWGVAALVCNWVPVRR